jgi:hypothetical protein
VNDRFSPLDSGEVISIAANDSQPGTIHRADMLTQTLAAKFQQLCEEHPELAIAWLADRGIDAEVLKYGAAGWQSGKLRIAIEFCPNPAVEETEKEIVATSPTAATVATPTPSLWQYGANEPDGDEELLLEPLSTPLSVADNYSAAVIETFPQRGRYANAQRCQGQIEASPLPMADVADATNDNDFSDPLATMAIDLTNFDLPVNNNDASFDAALETIDIDLNEFDIGAIGGNNFAEIHSFVDTAASPKDTTNNGWEDVVPPLDFLNSSEESGIEDIADLDVSAELDSMVLQSSSPDSRSLSVEAFSDFVEVFETGDLSGENLPPASANSHGLNSFAEDAFAGNFDEFGTAVIDGEDLAFGTFAEPEGIDVNSAATKNVIIADRDKDLDDFGTAVFDEDDLAFGTFAIDESISLNLSFDSLEMIATPKSLPLLDADIAKSLDDLPPIDEIWQANDRVSWP